MDGKVSGWVEQHARRIVKETAAFYGNAWMLEMSMESKKRAASSGVVSLMIAQHEQYAETLANLQAVAARVVQIIENGTAK